MEWAALDWLRRDEGRKFFRLGKFRKSEESLLTSIRMLFVSQSRKFPCKLSKSFTSPNLKKFTTSKSRIFPMNTKMFQRSSLATECLWICKGRFSNKLTSIVGLLDNLLIKEQHKIYLCLFSSNVCKWCEASKKKHNEVSARLVQHQDSAIK